MTAPGRFPDTCCCPLDRNGPCAKNLTECGLAWVVQYRHSVEPSLLDRVFGLLAALAWWRR